ncbi:MAG: hypothetical protein WBQ21_13945, partial [Solirubrobacteraceae bacterium]
MREGPLAALFRKTEDLEKESGAERAAASDAATTAGASDPVAEVRAQQPDASQSSAPQAPTPHNEPAEQQSAQSQLVPATAEHPRDSGVPHPSLHPSLEEEPDTRIPTPQERLRHAFSSEIPENLMDRPGRLTPQPPPPPTRARQEMHVREEPRPFGAAMPVTNPVIRVVGVGGAGTNAVNRMVEAEVEGVEFLAVNTDLQSLQQSTADITLHIGAELTRGLGSGSDSNVGRQAAMDDYDRVKALLKGSDMIFITAGAGGGTGTGAAPIVARIAREVGALTVAIVTKPFGFEGSCRAEQADRGVEALAEEVDTLIVVPNNRLL